MFMLAVNSFLSADGLKVAIVKQWYNVSEFVFNHLVTSVKNRVFKVIIKNGGKSYRCTYY